MERAAAPSLPLDEQFLIYGARLVRVKTVLERVGQLLDAEVVRAAVVRAVQERTVVHAAVWHVNAPSASGRRSANTHIGCAPRQT
jgi:hypothetical protein